MKNISLEMSCQRHLIRNSRAGKRNRTVILCLEGRRTSHYAIPASLELKRLIEISSISFLVFLHRLMQNESFLTETTFYLV